MAKIDKRKHHLESSYKWELGDLRDREPVKWDYLCDFFDFCGPASNGTDVGEHLKGIDVLPLRGQVLVDGNHLFLHTLRIAHTAITRWNRRADNPDKYKHSLIQKGWECPFEVSPRLLSYIAAQLLHRTIDLTTEKVATDLAPEETCLLSTEFPELRDPDWIVKNVSASSHTIIENDWEIICCDAPLLDQKKAVKELARRRRRYAKSSNVSDFQFEAVRKGQFNHCVGGKTFKENYELKNKYIKDLNSNHFASQNLGVKKHKTNYYTKGTTFYEKQVDVLLTMAMCDVSANKDLDWVCIITNDSDFVPAVERLVQAGKKVVWLCADEWDSHSKELEEIVPQGSAFCVDDLFERLPKGESRLFRTLFEIPGVHCHLEKLGPGGGEDPSEVFCSFAPWHKGYKEERDEEWAAMEREDT
jgi:uncharacterized LabA/DUF88 family protein